jgi:hypothetical protein
MMIGEAYSPRTLAASGQVFTGNGSTGGFLCATSGTLTLRATNSGGTVVCATMPVTAGVWHAIPLAWADGCYAELAGGATGTFGFRGGNS